MNQPAACRDDERAKPEGDRTENTAGAWSSVEGLMQLAGPSVVTQIPPRLCQRPGCHHLIRLETVLPPYMIVK